MNTGIHTVESDSGTSKSFTICSKHALYPISGPGNIMLRAVTISRQTVSSDVKCQLHSPCLALRFFNRRGVNFPLLEISVIDAGQDNLDPWVSHQANLFVRRYG